MFFVDVLFPGTMMGGAISFFIGAIALSAVASTLPGERLADAIYNVCGGQYYAKANDNVLYHRNMRL
jgi:hypothetical protein